MKSRKRVEFGERLNSRWLGYTAAAGAAGVGMLVSAQLANAEIVFTPANTPVAANTTLSFDPDHDGVLDFELGNTFDFECFQSFGGFCVSWAANGAMTARGLNSGNGIVRTRTSLGRLFAAQLAAGDAIGTFDKFSPSLAMAYFRSGPASNTFHGPWGGEGYLGLEFQIDGQAHYGWAELDAGFIDGRDGYAMTLLGYAYDTVPSQSLNAGQGATPEPGTLGLLALGSLGIGLWRRKVVTSEK